MEHGCNCACEAEAVEPLVVMKPAYDVARKTKYGEVFVYYVPGGDGKRLICFADASN